MNNAMTDENDINDIINIDIPKLSEKERLDKYLSNLDELDLSRNQIQKLIDDDLITVDGKPVKSNYKLSGGEEIVIEIPPPPVSDLIDENIPLDIVYEDEYLLVVNKPAGMVTHPAAGHYTGTLVNAVLYHVNQLSSIDPDRPGIVHRLDRDTSGLIMVAKDNVTHRKLQEMLKDRTITKKYHAIVCGHVPEDTGVIDAPIGRSMKDRKKMIVTNVKSREAITEYKLLDRFKLYDYVEVDLKTGRTHQIRVHFTHIGHPVLGDPDYGGREKWHKGVISYDKALANQSLSMIDRQALHAKSLSFIHPGTGGKLNLDSPLPEDFRALLDFQKNEGR